VLHVKSDFVEKLTHDSFVVQVRRITGRYQTRLDKLLSVFEQRYFIDDDEIIKNFPHIADVEELKIMTDILQHAGADAEAREELAKEREAVRTFMDALDALQVQIEERDEIIQQKDEAIQQKDEAIEERDKLIEELRRRLQEQSGENL
jgi:uncharacterized protein (DUF3084 family)